MSSTKGDQNTPKSRVTGASPDSENRPLSDVAPDDSAAQRGHGSHGTHGREPEERVDPTAAEPDLTKNVGRGSGGWGNETSGGSTFDKRGPEGK
jgi:hypothetical protein